MTQDPYAEVLKLSETQLRDAVSRLGNYHPEVLAMLNQYIGILRQCGQTEKADKLAIKATELKGIIEARAREAAAGQAAPAAAAPAPAPAAQTTPKAESNGGTSSSNAQPVQAAAQAAVGGASEEEEALKKAEERALARAAAAAAMEEKARAARALREAEEAQEAKNAPPDLWGDNEIYLFDSDGKHVAVAYKGALFLPDGRNIARWDDGLEAFLDRKGWYLGQIVQGNRLARDVTWQFRHMNFGDRGNEGNRSGWMRQSDEIRILLESGFEDVEIPDA